MLHRRAPADELAHIRSEIARLRRREAELREAYLTQPDMPRLGRWSRVEIVTQSRQVLEPRLLPEAIRSDPAFHRMKVTRVLHTLPHSAPAPRHPMLATVDGHLAAAPGLAVTLCELH
ncbi:hypothetical protein [Thioclava atlantica]|uniref:Uncharacterized protein n=1 Tax=Thioclava atlantica TaxID=1317124 RepID=A0A085TTW7_9RHOB|nr:hypothetical protein [Thioclava atlantica]KFE34164.1 hypothetical protein DW2_14225 [Thioclava atlantica]